jgi:GT2 family glycosyltransferase
MNHLYRIAEEKCSGNYILFFPHFYYNIPETFVESVIPSKESMCLTVSGDNFQTGPILVSKDIFEYASFPVAANDIGFITSFIENIEMNKLFIIQTNWFDFKLSEKKIFSKRHLAYHSLTGSESPLSFIVDNSKPIKTKLEFPVETSFKPTSIDSKVGIIILNYNQPWYTEECIYSIKKYTRVPYEIIIVDNGSTDDSISRLQKIKDITLISNKKNEGFSKGCNIGAAKSTSDFFLFLNNDTLVKKPLWLSNLLYQMKMDETIGAIGASGGVLDPITYKHLGFEPPGTITSCQYIEGWCLLLRRSVFEKLDGFDSKNFSPAYCEDSDLCFRVKDLGLSVIQYPTAIMHYGSVTAKSMKFDYKAATHKNVKRLISKHQLEKKVDYTKFSKILLFRQGATGDILNTTGAVHQIKKENPAIQIHYMVASASKEILYNNPDIDKVLTIESRHYDRNYDCIISFDDYGQPATSYLLEKIIKDNSYCYFRGYHPLMQTSLSCRKERGSLKKSYLDIFSEIAGVKYSKKPVFNPSYSSYNIKEPYVVLSMNSGWRSRNYPQTQQLIARFKKEGIQLVVTGGAGIINMENIMDLRGKTSLSDLYEIFKKAKACITIDSLPLHIACLADIPVFCLWSVTEPEHVVKTYPKKHKFLYSKSKNYPSYLEYEPSCWTGLDHPYVFSEFLKFYKEII